MVVIFGMFAWALAALIVLLSAVQPRAAQSTAYQQRHGQAEELDAERAKYYSDILTMRALVTALLLVIISALAVAVWGWFWGVLGALVLALQYQSVARLAFVRKFAQAQYDAREQYILRFYDKAGFILTILRGIPMSHTAAQIVSKEELLYMIEQAHGLLSKDELKAVEGVLQFGGKTVRDYMTPRGVIDSVKVNEHIGPLLLDTLHKTGHSRFPVIKDDLDHVVGILHIRELLTIRGNSKSLTVKEAMNKTVCYIREDQSLEHALAAFLKMRQHVFVVVNEYRETVGLLSLEDVIEQLIGRKILDEYDLHDDLRAVAARNPHGNNPTSKTAHDI